MIGFIFDGILLLLLVSFTIRSIFKTFNVISDFSDKKMERNYKRFSK